MYITRYSCQILMKLEFSPQIFEKYSNIKFHGYAPRESRVVPCGRPDIQADERTERDTTKLILAFCSIANVPKN
jgi:hypothetical protein